MDDKFGLLFGNGKQIRGQKTKLLDSTCREVISFYVKQSYILLVEKNALKRR